jgi:hypothetical protein
MRTPTTVTWTLTPVEAGTQMRVDHQGFDGVGGLLLAAMHRSGWRSMTRRRLPAHLRAGLAAR